MEYVHCIQYIKTVYYFKTVYYSYAYVIVLILGFIIIIKLLNEQKTYIVNSTTGELGRECALKNGTNSGVAVCDANVDRTGREQEQHNGNCLRGVRQEVHEEPLLIIREVERGTIDVLIFVHLTGSCVIRTSKVHLRTWKIRF